MGIHARQDWKSDVVFVTFVNSVVVAKSLVGALFFASQVVDKDFTLLPDLLFSAAFCAVRFFVAYAIALRPSLVATRSSDPDPAKGINTVLPSFE